MAHRWSPRAVIPVGLVRPVPVDPTGREGPTRGQAAGPRWRRTSPGLYVPVSAPALVEQRVVEVGARVPVGGAVTGWAALRMHGAAFFDGKGTDGQVLRPVTVVVPAGGNLRRTPGVTVVRERLSADEVVMVHGVPCTRPLRAAFDEVRRSAGLRPAVVALDMAMAGRLFDLARFTEYVASRQRWSGTRLARTATYWADERSLSPPETLMRLIWRLDAQLPPTLSNWPVADAEGRRLGRPDLLCDALGVVGQYEGADHRTGRQHASDVERDELYSAAGLECFFAVAADLRDVRRLVSRMHAAVERRRTSGRPRAWLIAAEPAPA